MEARIAKEVRESMTLGRLEQQVAASETSNQERFKTLKDQIWSNKQDVDRTHLEMNNKISTLEARLQSIPSNIPVPPAPPSAQ